MFSFFGIRHHGPGSANALQEALIAQKPDCLLIESPADAEVLIPYILNEHLVPPVAMLLYNPKDLRQAAYIPFAAFSPEWVAMQWALKNDVPVRFIDLPQANMLAMEAETQNLLIENNPENEAQAKDPLGYLATIAGYNDSERWWEVTFEQQLNNADIFQHISTMMCALRNNLQRLESRETLLREAFMRKNMRKALKDGFRNIAVVCGAWHVPALQVWNNFKESVDNNLLKGLKKIPIEATWIPWNYFRLSQQSGYGAGVHSPAWYQLLFNQRKEAHIIWLTRAAHLLRDADLFTSSAHIIDAVRLSVELSQLREYQIPGLQELADAAQSILCNGNIAPMDLINKQLIIGDVMGQVPHSVPSVPLQRDFEAAVKSARLSKEYESASVVIKELDLRKPSNLAASQLLHRVALLNIPWGKVIDGRKYATGNFSEHWELYWLPDYAIRIIEAGMWGNTLLTAATNLTIDKSNKAQQLEALGELLSIALKADLTNAIQPIINNLQSMAAHTDDVLALAKAMPPLVQVMRYGSARQFDTASVKYILHEIAPRVCINFPMVCQNIDEDNAKDVFQILHTTHHTFSILDESYYNELWYKALGVISEQTNCHPILAGISTRLLFDKKQLSLAKMAIMMRFALSKPNLEAAQWLDGFLYGSGLLLIHQQSLWELLDDWVADLNQENFKEILPLLRRTFSQFTSSERQKLIQLAQKKPAIFDSSNILDNYDKGRVKTLLPTLSLLLGDANDSQKTDN